MSLVHLFVQGKGGVGKTTLAFILAQYLEYLVREDLQLDEWLPGEAAPHGHDEAEQQERYAELLLKRPLLLDTDTNHTLAEFSGLNVEEVDIFSDGAIRDTRLKEVLRSMLSSERPLIVDTGANAGFTTFLHFMQVSRLEELMAAHGRQLVVHCVIGGGADTGPSLIGLEDTLTAFQDVPIWCWLNEYRDPCAVNVPGQRKPVMFEETKLYQTHKARIAGRLVHIQPPELEMVLELFAQMQRERLTFPEAKGAFDFLDQHYLANFRDCLFDSITRAGL